MEYKYKYETRKSSSILEKSIEEALLRPTDKSPHLSKKEVNYKPIRDPERTFSTRTFISTNSSHSPMLYVESMLIPEQEKVLTRDLLYLLTGVETLLITVHFISSNKVRFTIDERIDPSLKDQSLQIAEVATYYHTVQKYIEKATNFEHGKVNHALAAAMTTLLREYLILIGQLETKFGKDELTLQNLWFYIHQSIQKLSIMSSIAVSIEDKQARGGQVLSILHEKAITMAGDEIGQKICGILAEAASLPYFKIMESWIYKGLIHDPFSEFFIWEGDSKVLISENREFVASDEYWDKRYDTDDKACPSFLRKLSNEIIKAGKYLSVIRQCGQEFVIYQGPNIQYSIHEHSYIDPIQRAYKVASKTLLDLLLKDFDLMRRIESVKHYLLIDQGDFIVQFLDLTEDELCKKIDDLNETRLTSLLELALRTSSSCNDPYKDSVRVELFPAGIRDMLLSVCTIATPMESETFDLSRDFNTPGVEAFSLKFDVKWPVSLVLNERAVANYQLIFRHLFFCKHVERQLCQVWIEGKKHKVDQLKDRADKSLAFFLRQKMLIFVQSLLYYMAFEVIEPAWHTFLSTMAKVQNIDQVMEAHTSFLSSIVRDSMLTTSDLLDKITALLSYCLNFSKKFVKPHHRNSYKSKLSSGTEKVTAEFDEGFNNLLVKFLRDVTEIVQKPKQSSKVINIIHRINFNGYYTQALDQQEDQD